MWNLYFVSIFSAFPPIFEVKLALDISSTVKGMTVEPKGDFRLHF